MLFKTLLQTSSKLARAFRSRSLVLAAAVAFSGTAIAQTTGGFNAPAVVLVRERGEAASGRNSDMLLGLKVEGSEGQHQAALRMLLA